MFSVKMLTSYFVLFTGVNTARQTKAKIQAGGGIILQDFSTAVDSQGIVQSNVILISYAPLRTPKYIEALALNVPRISYRWIDVCVEKVGTMDTKDVMARMVL